MNEATLKEELTEAYMSKYAAGFKNNDRQIIDQLIEYPLHYSSNGETRIVTEFPIDPAMLRSEKQWDHSKDWRFEVRAISQRAAHADAYATRCRADGSVIERVYGSYGFRRIDGVWRMTSLAELVW